MKNYKRYIKTGKEKTTKICCGCEKEFEKSPKDTWARWFNKAKYCSKQCHYKVGHSREAKEKNRLAHIGKRQSNQTIEKRMATYKAKNINITSFLPINRMFNENNPQWKGNQVGYKALHDWVKFYLGKPHNCESCGRKNLSHNKYHWANRTGQYLRDVSDWLRLCARCHKLYDLSGHMEALLYK